MAALTEIALVSSGLNSRLYQPVGPVNITGLSDPRHTLRSRTVLKRILSQRTPPVIGTVRWNAVNGGQYHSKTGFGNRVAVLKHAETGNQPLFNVHVEYKFGFNQLIRLFNP